MILGRPRHVKRMKDELLDIGTRFGRYKEHERTQLEESSTEQRQLEESS